MISKISVLLLVASVAMAQYQPAAVDYSPKPYNFAYNVAGDDGSTHQRQETADGSGAVRGSYGYTGPLGIYRIVDYIADGNGYRATIRTNEPGTDNKNPADVQISAETPPAGAYQHRYQYARAARNPRPVQRTRY